MPRFTEARAWLKAHIPSDAGASVIHNDWRLDNVVLADRLSNSEVELRAAYQHFRRHAQKQAMLHHAYDTI